MLHMSACYACRYLTLTCKHTINLPLLGSLSAVCVCCMRSAFCASSAVIYSSSCDQCMYTCSLGGSILS
jgi:hypothetical protein